MITRIPRIELLASVVAFSLLACAPAPTAPGASSNASARMNAAASSSTSFGTAGSFAVLATTAVTCTDTTILGNVGVSPSGAITQTSCPVTGTIDTNDSVSAQAMADFLLAYTAFQAMPCTRTLTTLDGLTLSPGVYCFDAAVTSTGGVLTLNGPATGTWIFKVGTLGTGALTGTGFSVVTPNGTPPACNSVYWWVAEAATMTDSQFVGTILAGAAITLTRGTFNGDAFSKAAVTITGDAVTGCAIGSVTPSCNGKDRDEEACQCKDGDHEDDDGKGDDGEGDHGKKGHGKCFDHKGHHDRGHDNDGGHDDRDGGHDK
jgi:hypothetical protein